MSTLGQINLHTPILYNRKTMKFEEFLRAPRPDTCITRNPTGRGLLAVDKSDMDEEGKKMLESLLTGARNTSNNSDEDEKELRIINIAAAARLKMRKLESTQNAENVYAAIQAKIDELEGKKKLKNIEHILERYSSILNIGLLPKISSSHNLQEIMIEAIDELETVIQNKNKNDEKIGMNDCRDLLLGILQKSWPGIFVKDGYGLVHAKEDSDFKKEILGAVLPENIPTRSDLMGLSKKIRKKMKIDDEFNGLIVDMMGQYSGVLNFVCMKLTTTPKTRFQMYRNAAFATLEVCHPGMFTFSDDGKVIDLKEDRNKQQCN